jgi:hypothetical protein
VTVRPKIQSTDIHNAGSLASRLSDSVLLEAGDVFKVTLQFVLIAGTSPLGSFDYWSEALARAAYNSLGHFKIPNATNCPTNVNINVYHTGVPLVS